MDAGPKLQIWDQVSTPQVMNSLRLFTQITKHFILHRMAYQAMVDRIYLFSKNYQTVNGAHQRIWATLLTPSKMKAV